VVGWLSILEQGLMSQSTQFRSMGSHWVNAHAVVQTALRTAK